MNKLLVFVLIITLGGCKTSSIAGDPNSPKRAVVITHRNIAPTKRREGYIEFERRYIDINYPNHRIKEFRVKEYKRKVYDIYTLCSRKGGRLEIYFDITAFTGVKY